MKSIFQNKTRKGPIQKTTYSIVLIMQTSLPSIRVNENKDKLHQWKGRDKQRDEKNFKGPHWNDHAQKRRLDWGRLHQVYWRQTSHVSESFFVSHLLKNTWLHHTSRNPIFPSICTKLYLRISYHLVVQLSAITEW